jgi:hypothetical protein
MLCLSIHLQSQENQAKHSSFLSRSTGLHPTILLPFEISQTQTMRFLSAALGFLHFLLQADIVSMPGMSPTALASGVKGLPEHFKSLSLDMRSSTKFNNEYMLF